MAQHDPVDRNMLRLEMRRFQTRCEAQEGTLLRSDSIRQVARLGNIAIPYVLIDETAAIDVRNHLRRTAEDKARELLETLFGRLIKIDADRREKLRQMIREECQQLTGPLNSLRPWAQNRFAAIEQMLANEHH